MGLIKCPDCEQQISDNTKHCIHCGCVFQVCPECGNVLAGEHTFCPECGFQFENEKKNEEKKPVQEVNDEKSLMFWYALALKKPPIKIFSSVLGWIAFAFFVLAVFGTFATETFSEVFLDILLLVFLRTGASVVDVVGYLWIAFTSLSVIRGLISACCASEAQRFRQFAEVQGLNLPALIDNEFKRGFEKNTRSVLVERWNAILYAIEALLLKKDALYEHSVKQFHWWVFWEDCIIKFFFCVCAIVNAKTYMTYIGDFHYLKDWEWKYILIFVAVCVVCWIIDTILEHRNKKKDPTHTEWMQENLPQHLDAYTQLEKKVSTITAVTEDDVEDDY